MRRDDKRWASHILHNFKKFVEIRIQRRFNISLKHENVGKKLPTLEKIPPETSKS